jgi:hypothetical protein
MIATSGSWGQKAPFDSGSGDINARRRFSLSFFRFFRSCYHKTEPHSYTGPSPEISVCVISTVQSWPYSCSYSSSYFSSYLLFLGQKCNFFFRVKSSPSEMLFCTPQSILSHIFQAIIAWPGVGGLNVMISRSSKWSTLKPLLGQFASRRLVGEQNVANVF